MPRFAPRANVPMAVARSAGAYISAIIEWDGGLVPASPIPTPTRARARCQKVTARPQRAVMALKIASERAMIRLRTPRSAQRAMGMPRVVKNRAKAKPERNPSCVSVSPRSCLRGSFRMARICRSTMLKA